MKKILLIVFLILSLSSCESKENITDDNLSQEKSETIMQTNGLEFKKYKKTLTEQELSHYKDFFIIVDGNGKSLEVKKRLYDTNIVEIYAKDKDGNEIRKLVTIVKDSNSNDDKNHKLIEKPKPNPDKKYR